MIRKQFINTKLSLIFFTVANLFTACGDELDDTEGIFRHEYLKKQIEFLDADFPTVSSDWADNSADSYESKSWGSLMTEPDKIYLGVAYPKTDIDRAKFDHELVHEKNEAEMLLNTAFPYMTTIPAGVGGAAYQKEYEKMLASEEFKLVLEGKGGKIDSGLYYFVTYGDLKKFFLGRSDLGKQLIRAAYENTKSLKYVKGRRMLRLLNGYYTVYIETPQAFFKDEKYNKADSYKDGEEPVYAQQIIYGKAVWATIESEYSDEDIQLAFSRAKEYDFDTDKIKTDKAVSKIFDKSVITMLSIGNSEKISCEKVSIAELGKHLTARNYVDKSYGQPLFVKWQYVHNNSGITH